MNFVPKVHFRLIVKRLKIDHFPRVSNFFRAKLPLSATDGEESDASNSAKWADSMPIVDNRWISTSPATRRTIGERSIAANFSVSNNGTETDKLRSENFGFKRSSQYRISVHSHFLPSNDTIFPSSKLRYAFARTAG